MPKYKVRIDNNQSFTIKDGFTYEDNLNETLDSAKVVFETEGEVNVESFDDITIYDDSLEPSIQEKNMLVDTGIDEIAYFKPVEATKYELNIFSRTKWLERFTCPNLAITKSNSVVRRETVVLSGTVNVSGSKDDGNKDVNIPLDTNITKITYNSISIVANLQVGQLLDTGNNYYYNSEAVNNLPSASHQNIGKFLAVKERQEPSPVVPLLKLKTTDTSYYDCVNYNHSSFPNTGADGQCIAVQKLEADYDYELATTEVEEIIEGQNPSASGSDGQACVTKYKAIVPTNHNYNEEEVRIWTYHRCYPDTQNDSRVYWLNSQNNPVYIDADSTNVGKYVACVYQGVAWMYRCIQLSANLYVWERQLSSSGVSAPQSIYWYPYRNSNSNYYKWNDDNQEFVQVQESDIFRQWRYEVLLGVGSWQYRGVVPSSGFSYYKDNAFYQWSSGYFISSNPSSYSSLGYYLYYYDSSDNKWHDSESTMSSFSISYFLGIDYKYYRWINASNQFEEFTNYQYNWKLYTQLTTRWESAGDIGSGYYKYNNDYYKWDSNDEEWKNGYIFANIVSTSSLGNIIYNIGDNDNPSTSINGVISYNVNATKITYRQGENVWEYIKRYCDLYVPKVHVRNASNVLEYLSKYKIASRVRTKFEGITCPEFQWNEPTLREVLTDLMSTANCIPIINSDNEIDYMDLSLTYNPIDTSKIERIRSSFVSSDCCNELTVSLKNAIGKVSTRITEYTSLRSLTGEITTANAVLKTQKPIYDIKKVTLCQFRDAGVQDQNPYKYHEIDITDYVVEKRVWDTFVTVNRISDADISILKATHAYYVRGSNTIDGWGLMYTMRGFLGVKTNQNTLYWMEMVLSLPLVSRGDMRDFMFKVEYETLSEHAMHVGKYLPSKHYGNRIFDNQSNSYVDVQHQSIFEYCKVNRLGNKIKTMYAIYNSEVEIPKLGDYITQNGEKLVLFNRKIQYYDSQLVFEGQMLANYVLKDYFTGIMAKKRSWAIAEGKEALDRKDIYKYYVEASFSNKTDSEVNSLITYAKLLSAFTDYSAGNSIKWTLMRTTDSTLVDYPSKNDVYSLDSSKEVAGNSLIMSFGLGDNFSAGSYSEVDEDGAYHNNDYPYTDEAGEFMNVELMFVSYVNPSDGDFTWPTGVGYSSESTMNTVYAKGRIKNKVKESAATKVFSLTKEYLYKDNREIISGEIQFELCSDTPNILVKNPIWEYCSLYNDEGYNKSSLSVYVSNSETYELNDEFGKGTSQGNGSLITLNNNQVSISFSGSFKSWAICDSNGKILIAVNSTSVKAVYLNLLSTRDRHIYNLNREIIGSLDS